MGFPVHDWQFWVATAVFAIAGLWLLRGVLPVPFLTARYKRRKRQRRVSLTVGGRVVGAEGPERQRGPGPALSGGSAATADEPSSR